MKITAEALKEVIKKHVTWLNDEVGGERADLHGADLSCANLFGVDLSRAKGVTK